MQDVLPALIETYGTAAASVSADWYDEARDLLEAARSVPRHPGRGDRHGRRRPRWLGRLAALPGRAGLAPHRTLVKGGIQLRIANASRVTVTGSASPTRRRMAGSVQGQAPATSAPS